MIGNGYWATGISVWRTYAGSGHDGWAAQVDYFDDGFADDIPGTTTISTEGSLRTRYAVRDTDAGEASLARVIDVIKADAERLGIRWHNAVGEPALYYPGEGEWEDRPAPDGWRDLLGQQAQRIGWRSPYTELDRVTTPERIELVPVTTEDGQYSPEFLAIFGKEAER